MAEETDPLITPRVEPTPHVTPRHETNQDNRKNSGQRRTKPKRQSKDYLRTLQKAAEEANSLLIKRKSRYRFCIFSKDGEVFIDLAILGEDGKIVEERTRPITHESFERWIEDLSAIEGLYFDQRA